MESFNLPTKENVYCFYTKLKTLGWWKTMQVTCDQVLHSPLLILSISPQRLGEFYFWYKTTYILFELESSIALMANI